MKNIAILIVLFNNFAIADDFAEVGLPIITVFDQDKYNAHNQNWDIEQAENQLIYVANGSGLLEYDGEKWNRYNTTNQSRIRDIEIVGNKIYITNVNDLGYFIANDIGQLTFHSLASKLAKKYSQFGELWSVAAVDDIVIFKSTEYFFIWDGKSIRVVADKKKSRVKMTVFEKKIYIKMYDDKSVYIIDAKANNILTKTPWLLPENSQIRTIKRDNDGNMVFFTGKYGIFKQQDRQLVHVDDVFKKGTYTYAAIKTADGSFIVATINEGLYFLSPQFVPQKNYQEFHDLNINAITTVIEDAQNNIWIAGNNGIAVMRPPAEISRYNKSHNEYGFNLKLMQDKLSFIGHGIFQIQSNQENPLYPPRFDKVNGVDYDWWDTLDFADLTFSATNNGLDIVKISNNSLQVIESIIKENMFNYSLAATDDFSHIFAATSKGLYHIYQDNNLWQHEIVAGIDLEVNDVALENNNIVWVGNSSAKLFRVTIASILSGKPQVMVFDKQHGIDNNKVVPFNLSLGMVFATNDGVMQYTGNPDKPLKFIENMPTIFTTKGQDAHLFYEDASNRLWYRIGNHSGFAYKQNNQWQVNENIFAYFPHRPINAFVSLAKNRMWFLMSDDNIYRMNVTKTINIPTIAPLYIRSINNLNNQQVIDSGIVTQLGVDLEYKANSIRVNYAMAAFAIPNKAVYRTKLNGLHQAKWSDWSDETYKDFTELRGNDYTLEVQAKDGFGRITISTKLNFTVLPPFYLNKTALIIYALLALALLTITAWLVQRWRTKKLQAHNIELVSLVDKKTIEIQGHVNELEQQQELKTRFFTNISHELRTPLSLIILPLQKLIKSNQKNLDTESQELLTLSLKNANGMKELVNQVLDVSRFEHKSMPIVVQKNDLVGFVENIGQQFNQWATENSQRIKISTPKNKIEMYFDRQIMEKIISNLLSNAIKYSGKETTIAISFFSAGNYAGLSIKDNGIGIAKEQCQQVFERYFKAAENNADYDSSGIGLSFVKEMVELHHGEIVLHSDTNIGCQFKLTFQLGHEHFTTVQYQATPQQSQTLKQSHPEDTAVVMIVEDNTDLRNFISKSLAFNYKVIQAINGVDALQTLTHELPDLIISDIMMPQMDGIEFLQKVRQQAQFKTIPFFLLSSKSTQIDTQIGLQYGADDYLTKPFDMDELILRVKNMINSRKLIRKQVQQQLHEIKQNTPVELGRFEQKMREVILDNISDSHFNVNRLAEHFGLERSALFRKTKQELNISPSKYIRQIRLETAKELLEKDRITVSEVAYASGFESLSYFSKTFKHRFGQAPSNFTSLA